MFISDFAIRKPIITVVSMLALVVFGLAALMLLKTDEFPDVQPPIVVVSVLYPGAAPENVEREVIEPIEDVVSGISGVSQIQSSALDSFAVFIIQFAYEKDLQEATQQIRDEVNAIRNDLPPEMEEPVLTRFDPADLPVVSLVLSSPGVSGPELTLLADPGIVRRLRGLQGVAQAKVVGGIQRELTVELRPQALQAAGVGVAQVVGALQAQNLSAPVGRLLGSLDERTIRLRGRLAAPADFERLVISESNGRLVRLGDVAAVRDGTEEPRSAAIFDGAEAVGIEIVKSKGYSTTAVAQAIRDEVARLQATLPPGVSLRIVRDAGTRVAQSVGDVEYALVEGAVLTVLVVFLFLNSWRSTVITGVALPISVIASFIAVLLFGFTLNTMSLLGLSLAIGILIDDAIVVRENIVRHVEMGKDHVTAAHEGTSEIGLAVAATTFSIVVVFVPVAFMGGEAEQWFAPFALTIACSVLVSLFVSFSLDPMLSAYWPDPHVPTERRWFISRWLERFNAWFNRQADGYKRLIGWALKYRWSMVALATLSFFAALALPALGIVGGSFFPVQDVSEFNVIIETPPGSNIAYTKLKAEEVARLARSRSEVAYTYATIGGSGGMGSASGAVDEANVYVRLTPKQDRAKHQEVIAQELRRDVARIGGVSAWISKDTFGNQKEIQVQLRGPDITELNRLAQTLADQLRATPGAVDVGLSTKGQKPEIDVELDRPLAGTLGVTVGQVAQSLRPAFAGIDAGDWVDPIGKTRDVTVRFVPEARASVADLERLPLAVRGPAGPVAIPLGQVARINRGLGPAKIDHLDRERVITIQANTENRALTEVIREFEAKLASFPLPAGYEISQGGQTKDQQEVFTRILVALGVALLLMYFVLVVQFGSFLDPLAILLSLPLSLIGVMLALWVTGSTLNIMSMIGVILLMGIVAKNAILLIDYAKAAEEQGLPRRAAIVEAGRVRLRPILMTTFALIAGMIPVAIGSGEGADFRAPLGRAVIGGVITSTVLTLLVIPTVYDIMSGWRDRVMGMLKGRSKAERNVRGEAAVPGAEPGLAREAVSPGA
ncbi:MAG: efflux RND transporter permease subunit [Vicinamibacterales bacterium]|jgi:hydrophobe/amphiphile efflux-1 (HAE1) family protein|nr:efflux RND transporter permease subunit [Vicinamibacterales bacterium]